jgi:hypothetical protein
MAGKRKGPALGGGELVGRRDVNSGSSGFRVLRPQRRCTSVGKTEREGRKDKRRFRGEYATSIPHVLHPPMAGFFLLRP